jgi:hypothetical protein
MTSVTEFLLARIAEDVLKVRAECEAKRRIIGDLSVVTLWENGGRDLGMPPAYVEALHRILRVLALPYADHPEYDETWRP